MCGLLWSGGALVVRGLDLVKFMSSAGSLWLDGEVFSLLSMMVFLSLQVTDFLVSDGVVRLKVVGFIEVLSGCIINPVFDGVDVGLTS